MTEPYRFQPGSSPVLLSIPHLATAIPADVAAGMTAVAASSPDADWHLDRLYDFAPALGLGVLAATQSRYVIDLNRDPTGEPLYPGADNTELCPTTTFDREPLYREGQAPVAREIAGRIEAYWQPYHDRLARELDALRARFGVAVLLDAHSIRSQVPRFFAGRLTDFNLGTAGGASASGELASRLMEALAASDRYSLVLNGRFKGGYITRCYGRPDRNVHAVQLELSQRTYMDEVPPFAFRDDLASLVQPSLERLVAAMLDWAWGQAQTRDRAVI